MKFVRLLGIAIGAIVSSVIAFAAADPIEGKWFGIADQPGDPAQFGFEIKRNAKGELVAFIHNITLQHNGNFVGAVRAEEDGTYTIAGANTKLTLQGEALTGVVGPLNVPVRMERTETFPERLTIPEGIPPGPGPKWRSQLGAPIYAAPVADDDCAYVGTTGGLFHAVSLKDGRFKWAFPAGRPIHGQATIDGDALYFVCDNGYLFKLARADGKEIWRYDLGDAQVPRVLLHFMNLENDNRSPRPIVADGTIYVGSGDGSFHAVDAASGARRWRVAAPGKVRQTAALAGDLVIFGTTGDERGYDMNRGNLYALRRATGELAWKYDVRGAVTSAPTVMGDTLILGSRGSILAGLDAQTGAVRWQKYFWGSWVESTPTPAGELFYLGAADLRTARAYDPKDGSYRWSTYMHGWTWGAPAVSDTTVYYGVGATILPLPFRPYNASLTAIDRGTGEIKWRWVPPDLPGMLFNGFGAGPVMAGDQLLASGLDGQLYAFPLE